MNTVTMNVAADLSLPAFVPTIKVKQYDNNGRVLKVYLYNNGAVYTPGSSVKASIEGTKPDGYAIANDCSISGNVVSITITQQMTTASGLYKVDLLLIEGTTRIGKATFKLHVDNAAVQDMTLESTSEYLTLLNALSKTNSFETRLNNIVASAGTSNTEIVDARVGADGTTYDTAGNAIRGQISELNENIERIETKLTFVDGYIGVNGSYINGDATRKCTDYVLCPGNTQIDYAAESGNVNINAISFYDMYKKFISGKSNVGVNGTALNVISPSETRYCRLSTNTEIFNVSYLKFGSGFLNEMSGRIDDVDNRVCEDVYKSLLSYLTTDLVSSVSKTTFNTNNNGFTVESGGYNFIRYKIYGRSIKDIYVFAKTTSVFQIAINSTDFTINKEFIDAYKTSDDWMLAKIPISKFSADYPSLTIRFDNRSGSTADMVVSQYCIGYIADIGNGLETFFVSPDGSDGNNGTSYDSPFATINKALRSGAKRIMCFGGKYYQTIDMSNAMHEDIEISSYSTTQNPVFYSPDSLISSTESAVSGYQYVYEASVTKTFASGNNWIYQDSIADYTTLISDAERCSAERGQAYRCLDTRIVLCTATTLNDALTEIEASGETNNATYKWFYDSSNSVLYFSRPQAISQANPLMGSFNGSFISNASRKHRLIINGLCTKYMQFNLIGLSRPNVINCKATNVFGSGAFTYNTSLGCIFTMCEASRCVSGATGDGFNGHSNNSGDPFARQTTVELHECWSHDNNDDGYSDHERSETIVTGGLYEYNGKAGITPSYGSHCTCHDVYSRKNYSGFYYVGVPETSEGGKYGQMTCYNCVAENNTRGIGNNGFGVNGAGNRAMLVNCKSIGNKNGYEADAGTTMRIIDCGAINNTNITSGEGTFEKINTMIVS